MLETTNYGLKKIELTDSPPDITVMNPNWDTIDGELKAHEGQIDDLEANKADLVNGKVPSGQLPPMNYLSPTDDGKDVTVTFTESGSRTNIATGEKLSALFGKIKKYFTDMKTVAFTGNYTDLTNKPTSLPANGGTSAACSGNSATATKLITPRAINGINFDGTGNITIPTTDSTKAPISHASTTATYGLGTETYNGHCRVRNDLTSTAFANGEALAAYQGFVLKDMLDSKVNKQNLVRDVEYTFYCNTILIVSSVYDLNNDCFRIDGFDRFKGELTGPYFIFGAYSYDDDRWFFTCVKNNGTVVSQTSTSSIAGRIRIKPISSTSNQPITVYY